MAAGTRTRLIAAAVLLAVAVPLAIVAVSGSGDSEGGGSGSASLKVERFTGARPEIVVYVEDPGLNTTEVTGGATSVKIECLDARKAVVVSQSHPWPFTDTDEGSLHPHQHLAVGRAALEQVSSCRLRGTEPRLEGRLL